MDHDAHFLTRLKRLSGEHAELALGLYYDSALVEHILKESNLPDQAKRVALCLGSEDRGPHIIVARDGGFVTALGEGMVVRPETPVVSRHRLDTISETIQSLRELVTGAHAGGGKRTRRLLQGVFRAGPGVSQEEFDELARWLPLLQLEFLDALVDRTHRCSRTFVGLCRHKRLKRRHDEILHRFWRDTWATAHLTMLLAADGGACARRLLGLWEEDNPGRPSQIPVGLVRTGLLSFAARGAWFGGKMHSVMVPGAKRRYLGEDAPSKNVLSDALILAAAGLRHRRYRAEIGKVLSKRPASLAAPASVAEAIRGIALDRFQHCLDEGEATLEFVTAHARDVMRKNCQPILEAFEAGPDAVDELPAQVPVSLYLTVPISVGSDAYGISHLFELLSWIVGAEARDFYVREPFVRFVRGPWTREDGLLLFESCKGAGIRKAQPVVKGPKIGRNARCPCGSGRKYKRCCGGTPSPRRRWRLASATSLGMLLTLGCAIVVVVARPEPALGLQGSRPTTSSNESPTGESLCCPRAVSLRLQLHQGGSPREPTGPRKAMIPTGCGPRPRHRWGFSHPVGITPRGPLRAHRQANAGIRPSRRLGASPAMPSGLGLGACGGQN